MRSERAVTAHYGRTGIAARILAALGTETPTVEMLEPVDHFHGRGVAATRELVAMLKPQPEEAVLDIGSGIGGPARWIAATCGCRVTGVDLTGPFCEAARALNAATGLGDRVRIVEGSALALPLPDAAFDCAYSQNVVMNIADKLAMYREAFRVLKPGGRLALSNLCAGRDLAGFRYPVPWAATPATSFLATPEEMRADLVAAGFEIAVFRDTTDETLPAVIRNRERLERDGLPPLGTHLILGEELREMGINSARNVEEGRARSIEALVRKPR